MKILAAILLLLGLGNLVGALAGGPRWETVLGVVIGVALIAVAAGILKRKSFAWPLGFTAIGLGTIYFVVSSLSFAAGKEGFERIVLLSSCVIGALLVAAYWSWIWYRQRGYFVPDEPTA
jgi:hypothetical protein